MLLSAFSLAGYFFFRSTGWPAWLGPFAGFAVGLAIIYLETKFENRSGREILVAVIGLIVFIRYRGLPMWKVADACAPAIMIGEKASDLILEPT